MTKKVNVILKHSSIEDKIPTAEQLEVGELALNNFKDKEFLSFKNTDGEIVKISPSGNKEVIENLQNQISGVTSALTNYELSSAHTNDIQDVNRQISILRGGYRRIERTVENYPQYPDYFFSNYRDLDSSVDRDKVGQFQQKFLEYMGDLFQHPHNYYNDIFFQGFQDYFYRYLKGELGSNGNSDIRQGLSEFFKYNLDHYPGTKYTDNYVEGLNDYMMNYAFNDRTDRNLIKYIYNSLTGSTDVITKDKLDEYNYAKTDYLDNRIGGLEEQTNAYLGELKSNIPTKTSQLTNDSDYVTKTDLDGKLDATAYTAPDLSSYAKKTDIPTVPTKTSELTNDSGFITGVDLSNYDTITDVNSKLEKKLDSTAYTPVDLSSYAKKSEIPSVPTKTSELTNDSGYITGVDLSNYDTITDVNSKLEKKLDATAYTPTDLSSYAKKSDIPTVPTKTSQLTNDSGYITGVDLSNYDTITDVNSKLEKKLDSTAYTAPDLSIYAKKSEIPSKTSQLSNDSSYVTKTDLDTKLDATAYTPTDLSNYAKKSDVPTKTSQLTNDSRFITNDGMSDYYKEVDRKLATKQDKVNNIVVGKTASYTLQSVTESEWESLSGSADSNTIYFIK